jgi:hypothetical protein
MAHDIRRDAGRHLGRERVRSEGQRDVQSGDIEHHRHAARDHCGRQQDAQIPQPVEFAVQSPADEQLRRGHRAQGLTDRIGGHGEPRVMGQSAPQQQRADEHRRREAQATQQQSGHSDAVGKPGDGHAGDQGHVRGIERMQEPQSHRTGSEVAQAQYQTLQTGQGERTRWRARLHCGLRRRRLRRLAQRRAADRLGGFDRLRTVNAHAVTAKATEPVLQSHARRCGADANRRQLRKVIPGRRCCRCIILHTDAQLLARHIDQHEHVQCPRAQQR